jgi:hypothetical protein
MRKTLNKEEKEQYEKYRTKLTTGDAESAGSQPFPTPILLLNRFKKLKPGSSFVK